MSTASRLKVGVDVPWVTSWSAEPFVGVRPCPSVGGALAVAQVDRAGFGRPIYSMNHAVRQRLSVARMLCPMCGTPTQAGDRWTQTGRRRTAATLRANGLGHAVPGALPDQAEVLDCGSIAPLHGACARRSLSQCPHLRELPEKRLLRFPDRWAVAPLLVEARPVDAPSHALAVQPRPAPVVAFLQLCGF